MLVKRGKRFDQSQRIFFISYDTNIRQSSTVNNVRVNNLQQPWMDLFMVKCIRPNPFRKYTYRFMHVPEDLKATRAKLIKSPSFN